MRLPLVDLTGPAGRIEALLEEAPGARFAALVCHPHPLYGGTMHNHATYRLARAVRAAGGATLRFNYRGVGRSAGAYAGGPGEVEDARAALAHLRGLGRGQLVLCGFSFGAWVAAECAREPGVVGLLLAGLALRSPELESLRQAEEAGSARRRGEGEARAIGEHVRAVRQALAVVQAERDEFGAPAEVRELLAGSEGPRRLTSVPGTTHLFGEDLDGFERAASEALGWVLAEAPGARAPLPPGALPGALS